MTQISEISICAISEICGVKSPSSFTLPRLRLTGYSCGVTDLPPESQKRMMSTSPAPQPSLRARLWRVVASPDAVIVLALTALWALFFWRLLTPIAADRLMFAPGDFGLHFFPFTDYMSSRIWQGQIPLWNPYNYAGEPFSPNPQWAAWYPLRWLSILLAGPGGWSIEALQLEVAAHYWLASLFTYAFLRTIIKRPFAALAGALIFAYGGYLTSFPMLQSSIAETSAWLPLVLLCAYQSVHAGRRQAVWAAGGGLALGVAMLAGHPQTAMYVAYMAGAFLLFVGWQQRLRWHQIVWRGALLFGVGLGIGAVLLVPLAQFAALSARVTEYHYADKAGGFAPSELLQVMWPNADGLRSPLYIGAAGLILAAGAAIRRRAEHAFWAGTAIVALLLSLGGFSIVFDLLYAIAPGVGLFRQQERVVFLFAFAAAVLAAYEVAWLLSQRAPNAQYGDALAQRRFRLLARGHLIVAALAVGAVAVVGFTQGGVPDTPVDNVLVFVALISLLFNGWLAWQHGHTWTGHTRSAWHMAPAGALLAALLVVDLFTVGTRSDNFEPDVPANHIRMPADMAPLQVNNMDVQFHVDGAVGLNGYGTLLRIPDIYGTGPVELDAIARLLTIPVDRFWEVLAVRYVGIPLDSGFPPGVEAQLMGTFQNFKGDYYILAELQDPRPFAWLVYDYRAAGSEEFARQIMADPDIKLRRTAVTLYPLPFELPGHRPDGAQVSDFHMLTPEHLTMRVTTSDNALLTIATMNYPGWVATVDGKRVPIVDTYAGLIGVPITPGSDQIVELRYVPVRVIVGGAISAATLLGVIALAVVVVVRERKKENHPQISQMTQID